MQPSGAPQHPWEFVPDPGFGAGSGSPAAPGQSGAIPGSGPGSGALHAIGSGIAAGGALIKGIGGYEAGKFNAKVARYNQMIAASDNVAQQQQVRDAARAAMGDQIASQGASGLALGTGSALDALHQSAINAQLDAMELRRKGAIQKTDYDIQRFNAKAQGTAAFVGGIVDAASSAFSAGANYAAAGS